MLRSKRSKIKTILTPQEQRALLSFQKLLNNKIGVDLVKLVLFGSRARSEGDEESDIDILVLIKNENYALKTKIWDLAYKVFSETDIMISPLVLSRVQFESLINHERLIAKSIQAEGIEL